MTECLVCQVPNTGQHFGVSCCRACAAFFRRTIQLRLQYKCRSNNNCDVTQKNRYCCRACRVAKCYALGMANHENARKEILRRRSTTEQQVPEDGPSSSEQSYESLFGYQTSPELVKKSERLSIDMTSFLKVRLDQIFRKTPSGALNSFCPLPLCHQALIAYEKHNAEWPNCTPQNIVHTAVVDLSSYVQANYTEVEHVANFCMSLTTFAQLPIEQKWVVYKHFWPQFTELDRTYVSARLLGYDRDDGRTVNFDGKVVNFTGHREGLPVIGDLPVVSDMSESQIRNLFEKSVFYSKKIFNDPFKTYQPDQFELMYMMMTIMWNVKDLTGIAEGTVITAEKQQSILSEELYRYYVSEKKTANYASRLYKMHHLMKGLDNVIKIRKEDGYMSKTFNVFKEDIFLTDLK